jgi:hypothetical protein
VDSRVLCPCCGACLKVDADQKAVIDHEAPKVARKFGSVDEAVGALKTHDVEREKKFAASVEAWRNQEGRPEPEVRRALREDEGATPPARSAT